MSVLSRLKAATRTNQPQAESVVVFTTLNLIAVATRTGDSPLWLWLFALLLWPSVAFTFNLIDPIPEDKE